MNIVSDLFISHLTDTGGTTCASDRNEAQFRRNGSRSGLFRYNFYDIIILYAHSFY